MLLAVVLTDDVVYSLLTCMLIETWFSLPLGYQQYQHSDSPKDWQFAFLCCHCIPHWHHGQIILWPCWYPHSIPSCYHNKSRNKKEGSVSLFSIPQQPVVTHPCIWIRCAQLLAPNIYSIPFKQPISCAPYKNQPLLHWCSLLQNSSKQSHPPPSGSAAAYYIFLNSCNVIYLQTNDMVLPSNCLLVPSRVSFMIFNALSLAVTVLQWCLFKAASWDIRSWTSAFNLYTCLVWSLFCFFKVTTWFNKPFTLASLYHLPLNKCCRVTWHVCRMHVTGLRTEWYLSNMTGDSYMIHSVEPYFHNITYSLCLETTYRFADLTT